jgi:hypothetical protein
MGHFFRSTDYATLCNLINLSDSEQRIQPLHRFNQTFDKSTCARLTEKSVNPAALNVKSEYHIY